MTSKDAKGTCKESIKHKNDTTANSENRHRALQEKDEDHRDEEKMTNKKMIY